MAGLATFYACQAQLCVEKLCKYQTIIFDSFRYYAKISRSISMVIDGKIFENGFISKSKFLKESTPTGQKILPKVPL